MRIFDSNGALIELNSWSLLFILIANVFFKLLHSVYFKYNLNAEKVEHLYIKAVY